MERSRQLGLHLLTMGENRLELLLVEVQEERERLLHAFLLALGATAFGLLAGVTLTAAIVVLFWTYAPISALVILSGLYTVAGICLYRRLAGLLRNWQMLSASLEQLRKDRACLEKLIT